MGLYLTSSVNDIRPEVLAELMKSMEQEMAERVPDHTTTWTDATNKTHTVNTYCESGQTPAECAATHQAKVAALEALYPPAT